MRAIVPERERVGLQRQLDRAALAWLQADALESLQRLQRPRHLRADALDVELRDFISGPPARVPDRHADRHGPVPGQRRCAHAQVRVLERRVAQAVSEWIQRLTLEILVRVALAD